MITLSEFVSALNTVGGITGVIQGGQLGRDYSKQGKTRLKMNKDIALGALGGGFLGSAIDYAMTRKVGGTLKDSLKRGAKLGGMYGSGGLIAGNLRYSNKLKKQYDDANPNQRSDKGIKRGNYNK